MRPYDQFSAQRAWYKSLFEVPGLDWLTMKYQPNLDNPDTFDVLERYRTLQRDVRKTNLLLSGILTFAALGYYGVALGILWFWSMKIGNDPGKVTEAVFTLSGFAMVLLPYMISESVKSLTRVSRSSLVVLEWPTRDFARDVDSLQDMLGVHDVRCLVGNGQESIDWCVPKHVKDRATEYLVGVAEEVKTLEAAGTSKSSLLAKEDAIENRKHFLKRKLAVLARLGVLARETDVRPFYQEAVRRLALKQAEAQIQG